MKEHSDMVYSKRVYSEMVKWLNILCKGIVTLYIMKGYSHRINSECEVTRKIVKEYSDSAYCERVHEISKCEQLLQ